MLKNYSPKINKKCQVIGKIKPTICKKNGVAYGSWIEISTNQTTATRPTYMIYELM